MSSSSIVDYRKPGLSDNSQRARPQTKLVGRPLPSRGNVSIGDSMRLWSSVVVAVLSATLLILPACTPTPEKPVPAAPIDKPQLSSTEAMGIAREHSVNSPQDKYESYFGKRVNHSGSTQGWSATYAGNGKWTVVYRLRSDDQVTVYRWTVFEAEKTAVYLGRYAE